MRYRPALVVAALSVALVVVPTFATPQSYMLAPGDTLTVDCSTTLSGTVGAAQAQLVCEALPNPSPTATAVPPTPTSVPPNVGRCGESNDLWHSPIVNGCATQHEHGDAPPAWVAASGHPAMFTHDGNTPNENILKHSSFKGYSARFNNQDVYVVMHLDTNPSGHSSRFHSYQLWVRDQAGAVSHWDGWQDFGAGNDTGPTIRRFGCDDTDNTRPVMAVNVQNCGVGLRFENWYPRAAGFEGGAGWMPDFGFNTSANYYFGGDPVDRATWVPTGNGNGTRRFEMAWYANRDGRRGSFYATQFGELVSGPDDARCSQSRTVGTRVYQNLCIHQTVQPTLRTIQFPGNAQQKSYDMTGVINPN